MTILLKILLVITFMGRNEAKSNQNGGREARGVHRLLKLRNCCEEVYLSILNKIVVYELCKMIFFATNQYIFF